MVSFISLWFSGACPQEGSKTDLVHSARFLVNRAEWTIFGRFWGLKWSVWHDCSANVQSRPFLKRANPDYSTVLSASGSRIGRLPEQSRPLPARYSRVIAQLARQSGEQLPGQVSIIDSWPFALSHKLRWWGIMHQSTSSFVVTANVTLEAAKYWNP